MLTFRHLFAKNLTVASKRKLRLLAVRNQEFTMLFAGLGILRLTTFNSACLYDLLLTIAAVCATHPANKKQDEFFPHVFQFT